jgi:predicted nucleic acid-binding protein
MISVYLDTNILILGSKKEEHNILKRLSQDGKIYLYSSDQCNLELHGKVFPSLRKKDEALKIYNNFMPTGDKNLDETIINYVNATTAEYYENRKKEEKEKEFWQDVNLLPINSPFGRLWSMASFSPVINSLIQKNFNEVDKLLKYGIEGYDAFHLIQAFSGGIKNFLTWDRSLIKKMNKIRLLGDLQVLTPKNFLERQKIVSTLIFK